MCLEQVEEARAARPKETTEAKSTIRTHPDRRGPNIHLTVESLETPVERIRTLEVQFRGPFGPPLSPSALAQVSL